MSNNAKVVRGQVRQIVKEMLEEILSEELIAAIEKKLNEKVESRLNQIDERQKDIQGFVVRQNAANFARKD